MRQFTLKQLFVWIGILCFETALAAPAMGGDRSETGRGLFTLSVVAPCTVIGGIAGAAIGRAFKDPLIGIIAATLLAIAGLLFGLCVAVFIGIACLGWPLGIC